MSAWLLWMTVATASAASPNGDKQLYATPIQQMEHLGRGVVALPAQGGEGIFVSWRVLGTDEADVMFDVLRNGQPVASNLRVSNFIDVEGTPEHRYAVAVKKGGIVVETTPAVTPWEKPWKQMKVDCPPKGQTPDGREYSYTPNDCSVGDIDGDGVYELFLKWDPSNSHDNAHSGYTGPVIIDCYRLFGERLWRIDLGNNIRAGAHYTQFMVYDFDGDGCAEMICKTAPGSMDGQGHYVSEAADDESIRATDNRASYVSTSWGRQGHILSGPEFLTVFSGQTGKAIHTVYYQPNRAFGVGGAPESGNWGDVRHEDRSGNRGERYLAGVAWLDGPNGHASAVMCRGYYTRSYLWAVDYSDGKLKTRWLHASLSPTTVEVTDAKGTTQTYTYSTNTSGLHKAYTAYGQGAHSLSVGDVDGDGCDEIMYGAAAIDHDGRLLYSTGLGHGDAIHLSDLDPDRPGLEFYMVQEQAPYGWHLRDARTGEILLHGTASEDTGRGLAADVVAEHRGSEFWSSASPDMHNIKGERIGTYRTVNFRIYWDGDLQDELFDGRFGGRSRRGNPGILKWNSETQDFEDILVDGRSFGDCDFSRTNNFTKSTPCLQADILGDWREELILWDGMDPSLLNIFTTHIPTDYRVPTLMHDHLYRMGICWQNTAYNQPPHVSNIEQLVK